MGSSIASIGTSCFNGGFINSAEVPINLLIDGNVISLGNRTFQDLGGSNSPSITLQIGTEDNPTTLTGYGSGNEKSFRNVGANITSLIMYVDSSVINNSIYSEDDNFANLKIAMFNTTTLPKLQVFQFNGRDII